MAVAHRPALLAALAWSVLVATASLPASAASDDEASSSASGARSGAASGAASKDEEEDAPTPAPLPVGTMAIASDADLVVEAMAVDVATDKIAYSYRLRNKGKSKLSLAASVTLPDLEVNSDNATVYALPSQTPENPVGLAVKANDQPVATTPYLQALALGIDRQSDLKGENIPLIPFGEATDKALADAKPDVLAKLVGLGLVTPRDPAQPDALVAADWTLHVVHGWTQALEPGSATNVSVSFTPVKAVYRVGAESLVGFDVLKTQVCLTPAVMTAARALLKTKGAQLDVVDITLSNDGPARWIDNPAASLAVRKPQANSVVAFCGMDQASSGKPVVTGKMPSTNEAAGLRILIFSAAGA